MDWAISQGIETATFHILTPYPSTALHTRITAEGRILTSDWNLYDTRHAVYQPARMSPEALERGYGRAYRDFYRWESILRGAATKDSVTGGLRHVAYAGGWKKCEPMWDLLIRAKRVSPMLHALEAVLTAFGRYPSSGSALPPIKETVEGTHQPTPNADGVVFTYAAHPVKPPNR